MKTRTKLFLGYFALLLAVVFISAVVVLRIYARTVQSRAERLQADALTLVPGVTTLEEVRSFASRADRPKGYAGFSGPICDDSQCDVSVGPMAFLNWENPLLRLFAPFGVRPADYSVIVEFADGRVRRVDYGVFYKARNDLILSRTVSLVQRFSADDLKSSTVLMSNRTFAVCAGRDERLHYQLVGIATDLTRERVHLNLACATSIFGCSDPSELFQTGETMTSESLRRGASHECSRGTLAWSSIWPSGTYPKPD